MEAVPQLYWSDAWQAIRHMSSASTTTGRCFASLTLAKLALGVTWADAGAALGLSASLTLHVSRIGQQGVTVNSGSYIEALRDATSHRLARAAPDYRQRRALAPKLLTTERHLSSLYLRLGATHLQPLLLRELIWTEWASGHPSMCKARQTCPPQSLTARRRIATQRHRWTPAASAALLDWCDVRERALLRPRRGGKAQLHASQEAS
jgi:hypothetical protein